MATRKPVRSKLDPFKDQLLQMDQDKITIDKMLAWLHGQKMKCSRNTLRHFLTTRRAARNRNHMLDSIALGSGQCQTLEKFFADNPAPEIATLIKIFCVLITQLSTEGAADPEMLKIANQLTRTALTFNFGQAKLVFTERKLVLEEGKVAETKKPVQAKALELCLAEAKKFPEVATVFQAAFDALDKAEEVPNGK